MTILVASTKVQVLRPASAEDTDAEHRTDEPAAATPVGVPVRAHISSPTGSRTFDPSGSQSSSQFKLLLDPTDVKNGDLVRDETDGQVYTVDWVAHRRGLLPHMVGGISATDRVS